MLNYLESSDGAELQDLMQQRFGQEAAKATVDPDISQYMLQKIHERLGTEKQQPQAPVAGLWLRRIAIAASVILIIGLGWRLFSSNKPAPSLARHTEKKSDSLHFFVRHEINTTGKEKRIQLPDGSLVLLADKSELTYREPFAGTRDIMLTGKAYFKVARDKTKPFVVTSGDVSVTALGTEFTVTDFKSTLQIVIRLYEGKVVVKAVSKANKRMKGDVYLLPGQEFVYGGRTAGKVQSFSLTPPDAEPEQILHQELSHEDPSLPQNTEVSWYMFNNESLDQVLADLASLYDVEIMYDKKDVQNIYFTGKYNNADEVETILKRICTLHGLTMSRKDKVFTITK